MKFNKIILCLIALAVSVNTCSLLVLADGEVQNSGLVDYSGGLKPMTEDEIRLKEETSVLSEHAYLNDLALERINEQLIEEDMEEVSYNTAKMGEETVIEGNDIIPFSVQNTQSLIPFLKKVDNSTDERTANCLPPIGYQGGFGSCGAFSSTYYQMTYMNALVKGYDVKNNPDKILSPKFTYNIGKKSDNSEDGIWPVIAYAIVQKHGCPFNIDFPYIDFNNPPLITASDYRGWPTEADVWEKALENKVERSGWGYIGDLKEKTPIENAQDPDLNLIKTYLANGYILNVVTHTEGWETEKISEGVEICTGVNAEGGLHAMTVVGYDDDFCYTVGKKQGCGAFKLINSWGNNDCETWFAYDALNEVSAINPTKERLKGWVNNEFTWVTMYKEYTPKLLARFDINTSNRGNVDLSLGYSDIFSDKPTEKWKPFIFNETKYIEENGGNNNFNINGTLGEGSASIVLDYTDLINEKEADTIDEELKWYISSNAKISNFQIKDIPFSKDYQTPCLDTLPNDKGIISNQCSLPLKVHYDKSWTISSNYPLKKDTVKFTTIYFKDINGNVIGSDTKLDNDNKNIFAVPRKPYKKGQYYSFIIDGIKTVAGNGLKAPIVKRFFVAPDNEEEVDYSIESSFTDENFLDIIRELVQKPNGVVYLSDVRDIKELDVSNSEITSLSGIEYFTSLEELNCSNNQIAQLNLSRNVNLKTLDASNNLLKEIDLSHNTLLTEVNLAGNECVKPTVKEFKINNGYLNHTNNFGNYFYGLNGKGDVTDLLVENPLPKIVFMGQSFYTYISLENSDFVDEVTIEMHRNDQNEKIEGKRVKLTSVGNGIFTGRETLPHSAEVYVNEARKGTINIFYTKINDETREEFLLGEYQAYLLMD